MEKSEITIPFEKDEYRILEEKGEAWGVDKVEVLRTALERLLTEISGTTEVLQECGLDAELREASDEKRIIEQKLYDFYNNEVRVENRKHRRGATSPYSVAIGLLEMPPLQE